MIKKAIFMVWLMSNEWCTLASESCVDKTQVCADQVHCVDCLRKHHCCTWCYDEEFSGPRCISKNSSQHESCNPKFIENNYPTKTWISPDKKQEFTDVEDDVDKAVQFKPSEYNINLRYGEPVNITIHYRPAKNYPLDLYYLMDLTFSMQPELDTLKHLGAELTTLLSDLTKNYRLAFGSYIDKVDMPAFLPDPGYLDNPCQLEGKTCEKGYLFKHKLNFTEDVEEFIDKVSDSGVSANIDDLEGGIDALMQIALCEERIGWFANSRKLVVIATDGGMHFAGDGILAGHVRKNKDECLIDPTGSYSPTEKYDYPSVEEINHKLTNKKINVIVAAKSTTLGFYRKMGELLKDVFFVGELKNESSNILALTKDGYYDFMKQVSLYINTTHINGLETEFFADCDGNRKWVKGADCMNAAEGKQQNFKIQFTLRKYQSVPSDTVYIEEKYVNDKITVNLNYVGSTCNCVNLEKTTVACVHGEVNCGECLCYEGWSGSNCSDECKADFTPCREVVDGRPFLTCYGRGDCQCGNCSCYEPYQGTYCQFSCPYNRYTRSVCGGHGVCIGDNQCKCDDQYTGKDCSCKNSTENCQVPGIFDEILCSNKGSCECDQCVCEQGYSGPYCETCDSCNGLCSHYELDVFEFIVNKKKQNSKLRIETVEYLEEEMCHYRYHAKDGQRCDILYSYAITSTDSVQIRSTTEKCSAPLAAGMVAGLIIVAFLALLVLVIIVWKGRNLYLDKKEYEQFLISQEQTHHREENPLYKDPTTSYKVPLELREMRKNQ